MIRSEVVRVKSNVHVMCWDGSTSELAARAMEGKGRLLWERRGHNLVGLAGRNLLRNFLDNDAPSGITHFGLGTSATALADGDVALGGEVLRDVVTQTIKSPSALTVKYFLGPAALNGTTIREAGLFNAASGPTMFARYLVSPVIVKDSSLVFTFGWVITFSAV